MKIHKTLNKSVAVTLITSSFLLQGCGNASAGSFIDRPPSSQSTEVQSFGDLFTTAASGTAPGTVNVDFGVLKSVLDRAVISGGLPVRLPLKLLGDAPTSVRIDRVERTSEDNAVLVGQVEGDVNSAVTLVMNKGVLIGNVRFGDRSESIEIRSAGNGLHTIRLSEPVAETEGSDCEEVHEPGASDDDSPAEVQRDPDDRAAPLANPVIDILVVYTPAAREVEGSPEAMQALIQMGIADTNQAMIDSGLPLQVRLAGTLELRQNESGNYSSDLSALKGKTDGKWDEVHAERNRIGADQVSLIGAYPRPTGVVGIGYWRSNSENPFTIVKHNTFSMYTFAHELGHNLGLTHSDGYVNRTAGFRTIIAYGRYPRIRRYSNPAIPFNGLAAGDSRHNEAAIIAKNAPAMAEFRTPPVPSPSLSQSSSSSPLLPQSFAVPSVPRM